MFEKPESLEELVGRIVRDAREASYEVSITDTRKRNAVLLRLAGKIEEAHDHLRKANEQDLAAGKKDGLSGAMLDRLELTPQRIAAMAEGVRQIAALPDPVGEEIERLRPPNGLDIR